MPLTMHTLQEVAQLVFAENMIDDVGFERFYNVLA